MDWTDHGIVLARRRHGETAAVVTLLTRDHGLHAGLVRGGAGKRAAGLYQPGTVVEAQWRARLPEHLGTYTCEGLSAMAGRILDDPGRLAALAASCALIELSCPEREPHQALYAATLGWLGVLEAPGWGADYVRWEVALLTELGYGLDLSVCAVTGVTEGLSHVSPRTGRAVAEAAAAPYRDRLLPLPAFLLGPGAAEAGAVLDGLRLTGHFLERHVTALHDRPLPPARSRLIDRIRRSATISGS